MLKERAAELSAQIETLRSGKQGQTVASTLATRRGELERNTRRLAEAAARVRLLREAQIAVVIDPAQCFAQKEAWRQIREQQRASAEFITSDAGVTEKRKVQITFDPLVKHLDQRSMDAWQQFVRERAPQIEDALLALFEKTARHNSTVREIKLRRSRIDVAKIRLPTSMEEVQTFRRDCVTLQSAWDQLVGSDVPDAVMTFLSRLTASPTKRAPLGLLTPEVRDWLDEREISDGFSVAIG